jgi:tyrosinase
MTKGQLADFRQAIADAQALNDDRGYQRWAGIHGLPLPISCTHNSPLFLPWHRAYLYFFEKALQDRVDGATLPWWDWTMHHDEGLPPAYSRRRTAEGRTNPLHSSPIQRTGRTNPRETRTRRQPGPGTMLPSSGEVDRLVENEEFTVFQTQLESIHGGVHMWVGGTMTSIPSAAYDPIFWAHHCMIDRLWYLWQLRHPGGRPPGSLLDTALPPFPMTVRQTLDITQLGYDYAVSTTAASGPGHG